jgi:hypothetical protein
MNDPEDMPEKRCDMKEAHTAHVWIDKDGMPKLCVRVVVN